VKLNVHPQEEFVLLIQVHFLIQLRWIFFLFSVSGSCVCISSAVARSNLFFKEVEKLSLWLGDEENLGF